MPENSVIEHRLPNYKQVNRKIMDEFNRYRDTDDIRRSHFFAGRYENIYLSLTQVPAMQTVMDQAHRFAQKILKTDQELKRGFWFNLMLPEQITQQHTHDDYDERLSAVYYIDAPLNSGELLLSFQNEVVRIKPEAGKFVFFPPDIPHEVTKNKSHAERLSVGMNFGMALTDAELEI